MQATNKPLYDYVLRLADDALILGQRLSEWCGHGPILEQDIALTNMALDLIGEARLLFQYASELTDGEKSEDDIAFLRQAHEYKNVQLVELPNTDFAYTMIRQFFFSTYHELLLEELKKSKDERLAAIAEKTLKEAIYHYRFSAEWVIRLGDGTEVSNQKMQQALDDLYMYSGELWTPSAIEIEAAKQGFGVDLSALQPQFEQKIKDIFQRATLTIPENNWMQKGGKDGRHTEHMGFLLAEMQFMQRAYPNSEW